MASPRLPRVILFKPRGLDSRGGPFIPVYVLGFGRRCSEPHCARIVLLFHEYLIIAHHDRKPLFYIPVRDIRSIRYTKEMSDLVVHFGTERHYQYTVVFDRPTECAMFMKLAKQWNFVSIIRNGEEKIREYIPVRHEQPVEFDERPSTVSPYTAYLYSEDPYFEVANNGPNNRNQCQ